jgi:ABC-2 type transport system ATP-binding protein
LEANPVLELVQVEKNYKNTRAVHGISFCVNKGEVLGMMGSNGAGKSTTVSMIATLIKPDRGHIYYEGQDIVKNPSFMRRHLGYVPQEIALYPSLTGMDNLEFWGRANHVRGTCLKERITWVCSIVNLTGDMLNKKVAYCSGGMKRRLNIGASLLHKPELVILDEPAAGLDIESRNLILETVNKLKEQGTSIIYVGHDMEELEKISDKICLIEQGKCILFDDITKLLAGKKNLEQVYLQAKTKLSNFDCDTF